MGQRESIVRVITKYSASKIYNQILGALNAFVKPKLLAPEFFGLWNILNLLPGYASYIHLGARDAMRYLVPYHAARGETQTTHAIKGSVFYGSLLLNLVIAIPLTLFSLITDLNLEVRLGLISMALVIILNWYCEYYLAILKSYQNFSLITSSNYLRSTVVLVLSIVLIYFFGIYGVYLTSIISHVVILLYFRIRYPLEHHGRFDLRTFKDLVHDGFPIMIFSLLIVLMMTSGRIIVSYFLGNEQLGYYGIAVMILTALMHMPGTAREVMEPRLMEDLTVNSSYENFRSYFLKPVTHTAYYMPFLIGPVILALPVGIPLLLPHYMRSIVPAQILMFGVYFLALSYLFRGIIVVNKWQLKASFVTAFKLFLNIVLCVILVKAGFGLEGVALGSSISFFFLFIGLLVFVKREHKISRGHWKAILGPLYWPFPIMCSLIMLTTYAPGIIYLNEYLALLLKLAIYLLAMSVTVYLAQKKYPVLKKEM